MVQSRWLVRRSLATGRKKIDEDSVTQWIQARRKGESYRGIGRKFGVDPRTAKSWIQRAGEQKEKEHWEAVSRQVDAKYLDEHYRMLLKVAGAVSDAVHTDPVFVHNEFGARVLLDNSVQSAVQESADLLAGRGLNMSSRVSEFSPLPGIKDHKAERVGRRLLDALMQHEPQLSRVIETWESKWAKFQQERLRLINVAGNLFKLAGISDESAERLKIPIVQEALGNRLFNEEPSSCRVDDIDGKNAHLVRHNRRTSATVYTGAMPEVEAARKVYDRVLRQVSHEERVKPVEDSYRALIDSVKEAEVYIDKLILMGKPQGHCALCLNWSIHLS
jgi:hypothetical protein